MCGVSLWLPSYVHTCVCDACIYYVCVGGVGGCGCVHMDVEDRSRCLVFLSIILHDTAWERISHSASSLSMWLGWLARELWGEECPPISTFPVLSWVTDTCLYTWLLAGVGDLNLFSLVVWPALHPLGFLPSFIPILCWLTCWRRSWRQKGNSQLCKGL